MKTFLSLVALSLVACASSSPKSQPAPSPAPARPALAKPAPVCRTCVKVEPAAKAATYLGRVCRDGGTEHARSDERRPGEAIPVSASIHRNAAAETLVPLLVELGAIDPRVTDDRPLGGELRVHFSVADEAALSRILQRDEVLWAEPPGCINLDG